MGNDARLPDPAGSDPGTEDAIFGRLLVRHGIVDAAEVERCLRSQAEALRSGSAPVPRLGDLLRERGIVPARDASTVVPAGGGFRPSDGSVPEGERFGEYVKISLLGRGGFAEVWKAWDLRLSRWVALKILSFDEPEELHRFLREAQTAAGLTHPNIAAIYAVGSHDLRHFIAMQLVDGQTLQTHPRGDVREILRLLRDAARAVGFAHAQDIIHRDLKPANLMVDRTGRIFVMDFGLAKRSDRKGTLSVSGAILGTPAYMSPEQADGSRADRRSDVYGLGATLYDLLAGEPPFRADTAVELLAKIVNDDPVPLRRKRPDLDVDLQTIAMKCLEKDPDRRYPDASSLADDLTRFLDGDPIQARPSTWVYRTRKRLAKRRALAAVSGAAAILFFAVLLYWFSLRSEAHGWARQAERRFRAGEFEEAKKLFDQAKTRIGIDETLYLRCEIRLREIRAQAEERRREREIFGPVFLRIDSQPKTVDGWKRSLELITHVLSQHQDSPEAWMRKGTLHERLQEYEPALSAYAVAVGLNPLLADARYRRGKILLEIFGRRSEALAEFEAAQKADPENESLLVARARIAHLQGDPELALLLCNEAEPSGRHLVELHLIRGDAHHEQDPPDFDQCLLDYSHALELDPLCLAALNNRGIAYCRTHRLDEAIRDFDEALRIHPRFTGAWFNRGSARWGKDDFSGAADDFTRAIDTGSTDPRAWYYRARARRRTGDRSGAITDLEHALTLAPPAWNERTAAQAMFDRLRQQN